MSPDWNWKNFGKKKKKFSPPPQKRRPPTRDTLPQTPYRFKKRGCILRLTLIQHCHRKKITFALARVKHELHFAIISIMSRMLKHHIHPGFFLLFVWLCHLMEHQKVQGKPPSSSICCYFVRFLSNFHCCQSGRCKGERRPGRVGHFTWCCNRETFCFQKSVSFLWLLSALGENKTSCASDSAVRKASTKQVPSGALQSGTRRQVLQPVSWRMYSETATLFGGSRSFSAWAYSASLGWSARRLAIKKLLRICADYVRGVSFLIHVRASSL